MKIKREDFVNSFVKENIEAIRTADVFMNDVKNLLQNFNKVFEKDMENSDVEKFIEKYCIERPFDEIGGNSENDILNKREILRSNAKSKWDLIDLETFSPKYLIALDKMIENKQIKDMNESQEDTDSKAWNAVDDDWKQMTREFMNKKCFVDISLPEGVYDTIRRSYAIQGFKKRHPWIAMTKTTAKTVSDRFKKCRIKEGLRHQCKLSEEIIPEEEPTLPDWHQVEVMRNKCLEWMGYKSPPIEEKVETKK